MGETLGLPKDWLNDAAKGYVHGLALGAMILETPSLRVRTLAPEQLLAMKLLMLTYLAVRVRGLLLAGSAPR